MEHWRSAEHGAAFWGKAKEPIVASDPAPEPSTEPAGQKLMKRTRASAMMPRQCARTWT